MNRKSYGAAAIAAFMTIPQAALLAQDASEVQEMVRVSVAGDIVELTIEEAARACDIDVETLRADQAALEAGAGDPVSPVDLGAVASGEAVVADEADQDVEAGAAAGEAGAAAADGMDGAEETDPDATTTNDEVAMAGDGVASQGDAAGSALLGNAELEAAVDPSVPLPTAVAVCEIDRLRAEELELVAPD